ncbi:MAG: DUF3179 domain-containing (seleno)protein, partial [Planctomycetota bacterium]
GIQLKRLHVVTTNWGEWKRQHPETRVLSLQTGHRRDYGEGVAYRRYFGTDQLMFDVSVRDNRLKNKTSILAMRRGDQNAVAITADFLLANRIHHDSVGPDKVVVLTDDGGGNRVYKVGDLEISAGTHPQSFVDQNGGVWKQTEAGLISGSDKEKTLPRYPAHRAFWFGWYATYPNTRLVQ